MKALLNHGHGQEGDSAKALKRTWSLLKTLVSPGSTAPAYVQARPWARGTAYRDVSTVATCLAAVPQGSALAPRAARTEVRKKRRRQLGALAYATELETQMMRRAKRVWNGVRRRTHADTQWARLVELRDLSLAQKAAVHADGDGTPQLCIWGKGKTGDDM